MKDSVFQKMQKMLRGKSIIELCINDERELFRNFSALRGENISGNNGAKINGEIIRYLKDETKKAPMENDLTIKIKTAENINCKVEAIEKMIKADIEEQIIATGKKMGRITRSSVILAAIGMLLIGITQVFQISERRYSLNEFIIVMSWVFMWKAVELWFFKRADLMRKRGVLAKIFFSEIHFN